ncbi:MAG: bifunctional phosphopantothenoylcysteine decarboxylase/phosphopantothenate--cysteine ligase CoaBC [Bacteroidota bacterium]
MLRGKKIVVGITGSIAAYKIPFLVRLLVRAGAEVRVIMTPAATDFVTPLTLATLSQHGVITDPFKANTGEWNSHVELGTWADLMIFAPVTANTLGKMVNGIADNFVITAYLSAKCPVYIAPAMDLDMFAHPSTVNNIRILKSFGNHIIEPQVGELASGLSGPGRMEEPERILQIMNNHFLQKLSLLKKKVLITAGPTYERIDPVRFIGNFSTGAMGLALAMGAANRGADVTLIAGPVSLSAEHSRIKRVNVETAGQMYRHCMQEAPGSDIIIMAAAVADYTCAEVPAVKMKKGQGPLSLELIPTKDILAELGKQKKENQLLVGFALETDNEIDHAKQKLKQKNLDFIVLNSLQDPGAGFGGATNKVTILDNSGIVHQGSLKSKQEVAGDILDIVCKNITN